VPVSCARRRAHASRSSSRLTETRLKLVWRNAPLTMHKDAMPRCTGPRWRRFRQKGPDRGSGRCTRFLYAHQAEPDGLAEMRRSNRNAAPSRPRRDGLFPARRSLSSQTHFAAPSKPTRKPRNDAKNLRDGPAVRGSTGTFVSGAQPIAKFQKGNRPGRSAKRNNDRSAGLTATVGHPMGRRPAGVRYKKITL